MQCSSCGPHALLVHGTNAYPHASCVLCGPQKNEDKKRRSLRAFPLNGTKALRLYLICALWSSGERG